MRALQVIPDGWEQHHEPTAYGAMTGTCSITRPSALTTFDESTGTTTADEPTVLYTDACRVQALDNEQQTGSAGQLVSVRRYLVTVARTLNDVQPGDQVEVTDGDPHLAGRTLNVTDVTAGTLRWQRDLHCQLNEG